MTSADRRPGQAASLARAEARARDAHRRGVQVGSAGHPAAAARTVRAGLRALGWDEHGDRPEAQQVRRPHHALAARMLASLAHFESEQGRTEYGLGCDRAEALAVAEDRGVVLYQRGLVLIRTGRFGDALRLFDQAVALLQGHPDAAHLARALLNRGVCELNTGHVQLARSDLARCQPILEAAGLSWIAAKAMHNQGYCDLLTGDIPAALRLFDAAATSTRSAHQAICPCWPSTRPTRCWPRPGQRRRAPSWIPRSSLSGSNGSTKTALTRNSPGPRPRWRPVVPGSCPVLGRPPPCGTARRREPDVRGPGGTGPAASASDLASQCPAHRTSSSAARPATAGPGAAQRCRRGRAAWCPCAARRRLHQPSQATTHRNTPPRPGSIHRCQLATPAHQGRAGHGRPARHRPGGTAHWAGHDPGPRGLAAWNLQTGTAGLGTELAANGLRLALDRGSPTWSSPGSNALAPRHSVPPRYARRPTRTRPQPWPNCAISAAASGPPNLPGIATPSAAPGVPSCSGPSGSEAGRRGPREDHPASHPRRGERRPRGKPAEPGRDPGHRRAGSWPSSSALEPPGWSASARPARPPRPPAG